MTKSINKTEEHYRPIPDGLDILDSEYLSNITGRKERGLFATKDTPKGERWMTHVKTDDPIFDRGLIRLPIGGFFNHNSKNPNCKVMHCDNYVHLETIRDIKGGEELTAKYTLYDPEKNEENTTTIKVCKESEYDGDFFKEYFSDFDDDEEGQTIDHRFSTGMVPMEIERIHDGRILKLNKNNKTYSFKDFKELVDGYTWGRLFADHRCPGEFEVLTWAVIDLLDRIHNEDNEGI